jgi:hypothetical protein
VTVGNPPRTPTGAEIWPPPRHYRRVALKGAKSHVTTSRSRLGLSRTALPDTKEASAVRDQVADRREDPPQGSAKYDLELKDA